MYILTQINLFLPLKLDLIEHNHNHLLDLIMI
jgi:hypothetical protein